MTNISDDYKRFLDLKFKTLEDRMDKESKIIERRMDTEFNHVSARLDSILKEVIKTNGRIGKAEDEITHIKLHRAEGCPQNHRIVDLEKKWEKNETAFSDLSFIFRHPKFVISAIAVAIVTAIASIVIKFF
jgi:hypothetical protein